MELNGLTEFNILMDLYFSKYAKVEHTYGTVSEISSELGHPNGYTKSFLKRLINEGVLAYGHAIEVKGKQYNTYNINKEKLIEILKEVSEFSKAYIIIWDNVGTLLPELYEKDELKELKKFIE